MNELIKTNHNSAGEIIVSGRELHDFLEVGTQYTKWFDRMTDYGFDHGIDYLTVSQKRLTAQGNETTFIDHHIKLDMAKEIAMIQRSDKGKQARQYFLKIEKLWNSPEAIMKRALEYADRKMVELQSQIDKQQPLVNFAKTCMASEKALLVREVAKLVTKQGIVIGERRLYQKLREWKLIFANKNEPYQEYLDRGYFEISQGVKENAGGTHAWLTMRVTPKGQSYIFNRLKKENSKEVASIG
ncbi:antA/AntB antirepressor family protein [Metabacillus bambusae]|uniref:AntA/AntB antirepressor family protein n=1 Tax=Metabacillus bambusae TaxID=2795218 RepID=A0ABS3NBV8_9BACI|nr:antA/AntB antirepressor family protein [Metabacillus bambusae]MBO1515683.1 antA/AntB antirepressor family protein [Metabacillus bambusae]